MTTRHERLSNKALNEQHSRMLKELMQRADNRKCVDCRRKDPRWASWNLGVFMCIRCSGVHRSIGTHITKVKSADLDAWTPEQIASMQKWGNAKANFYWESLLGPGFEGPPESSIDQWIRDKYDGKRFAMRGPMIDPDSIPLPDGVAASTPSFQAASILPKTNTTSAPVASFAQFPPPASTQPTPSQPPLVNNYTHPAAQQPNQDLLDIFGSNSNSTATAASAHAANVKSDIMSLYANPAKPAATTQTQPQLAGLQFFNTATTTNSTQSSSFASFGAFPAPAVAAFAPAGLPQPAFGGALFPGASAGAVGAAKPAVGGIPDFMGLGGVVGGAMMPKSGVNPSGFGSGTFGQSQQGGANDKDGWGEFQ